MAIADTDLSISDAAGLTGLTPHTLRYYERAGLMLDPVARAHSSHRRYAERDLRWIELIAKLRATGMPIRAVREYAGLVRAGDGNEHQRLELLEAHRETVLARLEEMRAHLEAIDAKVALYREKCAGAGEA